MNYHFYISYTQKNSPLAQRVTELLNAKGYSAFIYPFMEAGIPYGQGITNAIKNSDYFILLLSSDCYESSHILNELDFAISRKKVIIPIKLDREELSLDYRYYLGRTTMLNFDPDNPDSLADVINTIDITYGGKIKRPALYEKLHEYHKIHDDNREALTLCELIVLVREEIKSNPSHAAELLRELYRLYESLNRFSGGYDEETRMTAIKVMNTLIETREILSLPNFTQYLLDAVIALHLIYFEHEIASECVDIRTNGDVHNPFPIETYIKRQQPFLDIYEKSCTKEGEFKHERSNVSDEDRTILKKTPSHIFAYHYHTSSTKTTEKTRTETKATPMSEDDEILHNIADFMQKGNELFNLLHKKGAAGDFLKCLLTSYERLKNYCMIVGANKVAADCVEKIAEIRQDLATAPISEASNDKAENGIKSLLGFTTQASGDYDVFISFKSEDADIAKSIYQFCKANMIEAFWSKVSLPELSKADYSDAINNALDNAKHFVLVLSDLSYLNSHWVKYEMETFSAEILEGRKDSANFVFVVTDALYDSLIASNKKTLPLRYRRYQILKLSEYEQTLLSYLKQ